MRIISTTEIIAVTRDEKWQQTLDAIAELEQQHAEGVIETPAYLMKKRALVRVL